MEHQWLDKPIDYLKGVGPQRGELLKKELHIFTIGDLLQHFPYRYMDRSRLQLIRDINSDEHYVQVKGIFHHLQEVPQQRGKRLTALLSDDTGTIEVVWFQGISWIKKSLKTGKEYLVFGKPSRFKERLNLVHPEIELISPDKNDSPLGLHPLYPSSEKLKAKGLDSKGIMKLIRTALQVLEERDLPELLPNFILQQYQFISRYQAYYNIHFPESESLMQKAKMRLKFEELFFIQLSLLSAKIQRAESSRGLVFARKKGRLHDFYHYLTSKKFQLTDDQLKVLRQIRSDVESGRQMNRLLQGDVGSGKTIVALMAMLMAIDSGFQACLMTPTEILAQQHFNTLNDYLNNSVSADIRLLTGSVKGKARQKILDDLKQGVVEIVVGTHALLENPVSFHNLGLAVIDEQHRFGVAQRARLWTKNETPPHVLVMTATPIPRTLAMTIYGDLDISVIKQLPPGRKPVETRWITDARRLELFGFMKKQIAQGRQIYVVYPLIEESEALDYKDLMDGYESISQAFPLPEYRVSVVHGKMKPEDKDREMQRFIRGETHIMVATTVIEVGVNVPNATVMVIESAERFGLSQLHQLRGRVGRGAHQSYCILVSGNKISEEAKKRLQTMVRTQDGFEIAEIDLELRGPGDIQGTRQSGFPLLRIADIVADQHILQQARHAARQLLNADPQLESPSYYLLKQKLLEVKKEGKKWSRIS